MLQRWIAHLGHCHDRQKPWDQCRTTCPWYCYRRGPSWHHSSRSLPQRNLWRCKATAGSDPDQRLLYPALPAEAAPQDKHTSRIMGPKPVTDGALLIPWSSPTVREQGEGRRGPHPRT
jgi:hypothetical protein